jgi:hypothetical protein
MFEEAGRLTGVHYGSYPDARTMVWIIRLSFEAGDWSLVVNPDDDTLLITEPFETDHAHFDSAPENSPWRLALGKRPRWIWTMTNQQGYQDGIQFEFADPGEAAVTIQMIAMASSWHIRQLAG